FVGFECGRQDLERDGASKALVFGAVDDAHAAFAEASDDVKSADARRVGKPALFRRIAARHVSKLAEQRLFLRLPRSAHGCRPSVAWAPAPRAALQSNAWTLPSAARPKSACVRFATAETTSPR